LLNLAVHEIPHHLLGLKVRDLWDPNSGWKWEIFFDLIPKEVLKNIVSIEVHPDDDLEDQLIWDSSGTGDFSIKYAISMIKLTMVVQVN